MTTVVFSVPSWQAFLICIFFAAMYVGSLYMWGTSTKHKSRDHPDVIKRRFVSVTLVCFVAPLLLWLVSTRSESVQANHMMDWLGIRFWGLLPSLVLPLILTMVLFLGPLSLHYLDGVFSLYLDGKYWTNSIKNYVWLRNHIVGPFTEEFVFRACMLPLLLPSLGVTWSIVLCPLVFGIGHFHHMIEKVVQGQQEVAEAFKQSLFQLAYTTVFGMYSAFLFLRTGHLMAPVIAHAFCNHMGFPAFGEVMGYPPSTRYKLMALFLLGMIAWLGLLYPLTTPWLFANTIYNVG